MIVTYEKDEKGVVSCFLFTKVDKRFKARKGKAARLIEECGSRIALDNGYSGEFGVFYLSKDSFDELVLKNNVESSREVRLSGVRSCRKEKDICVSLDDLIFAIKDPVTIKKPVASVMPASIGDTVSAAPSMTVTDAADVAAFDSNIPIEERAKAMWGKDQDLRVEFGNSFAGFLAFERNMEAGQIKIIGGRTVRG